MDDKMEEKPLTGRERSLQNLKSFKPGQSGNPAGRKPGTKEGLRARMKRMLQKEACSDVLQKLQDMGIDLEHRDNAEAIAYAAGWAAAMGDVKAMKFISEVTDEPFAKDLNVDFNILMDETDQQVL